MCIRDSVTPVGEGSKLALGAGYEGSVGFGKATWQSAIAATVGFRPIPAFTIALGYQVVFPDDDSQTVTETRHHPGFLGAGYRFLFGPRWDLELSGRATVDVVTQEHRHFEGEGSDTDLSVRVRVGPTAELGFRVLPPLRVGLLVGMEVLMNPADETKMVPGGMSTLFGTGDLKRPVTVAPSAADHFGFLGGLGLQFDLDLSGGRPRSGVARR